MIIEIRWRKNGVKLVSGSMVDRIICEEHQKECGVVHYTVDGTLNLSTYCRSISAVTKSGACG